MNKSSVQANTILGLVASLALAALKLVAGFLGHSSALVADAIESIADAIGSIFVWQALRVSGRPSDAKHPYGYGKAEALASLAIGTLLCVAAILIVVKASREIFIPHEPPEPWTLIILLIVVGVKEWMFRKLRLGAATFESDAAMSDAWHHRADAITSAAAFIGVSIAIIGHTYLHLPVLALADEVAAILASGIILLTAVDLIRPSLLELLDASSSEMEEKILQSAIKKEGVVHVEKVYVRKSGSLFHVDMHLHVDPELSIRVAHAIAGRVKAELIQEFPKLRGILIHIEPADTPPPSVAEATTPTNQPDREASE